MIRCFFLISFTLITLTLSAQCSPCGNLSNVSQNLNGNNLELTFTSNAGWQCCYEVSIELICENQNFTGVANHFSSQICLNGGGAPNSTWPNPAPYPLTVINIANLCPGTYKWRAWEEPCTNYTAEFTFVKPGNLLGVTANAVDPIICSGQSTNVTGSATNGCQGPFTFSWSPTTGVANPAVANTSITPPASGNYTLTVSEPGTCGTISSSATIAITVLPPPTATISSDATVCAGDDAPIITITGANGTAPYTIDYTINGVPQPEITTTGNSASISAPTMVTGSYTYEITNVVEGSAAECKNDLLESVTIVVNPIPQINAGNDIEFCQSSPTAPSSITLSGTGGVSYSWDHGVSNGVAFPPINGITTYTVTGTDANGCTETDQVTVSAYPQPIASAVPDNSTGSTPFIPNFDNQSIDAGTCIWDFGDGSSLSQNPAGDISHTYNQAGTYTVTLIVNNGLCSDTTSFQLLVFGEVTVITPNVFSPNEDGINDSFYVTIKNGEVFDAQIFNRWGQLVAQIDNSNPNWNGKASNGIDCLEGVYFLKYRALNFNGEEISGQSFFHLIR